MEGWSGAFSGCAVGEGIGASDAWGAKVAGDGEAEGTGVAFSDAAFTGEKPIVTTASSDPRVRDFMVWRGRPEHSLSLKQ